MRRIRQISIKNLFGIFTHDILLHTDERVTIIHSPNGFGKTAILKLLNELFTQGTSVFRTTPFDEFHVYFEDHVKACELDLRLALSHFCSLDVIANEIKGRVFSQSTGKQIIADLTNTLVGTSQGFSFKESGGGTPAEGPAVVRFSTPALPANTHTLQFQIKILALTPLLLHLPHAGTPLQQLSINGSVSFDFTLPYHNRLVVTPNQTLKINRSSVTLARVLISPSETILEGTTKGVIPGLSDYTFSLDAAGLNSSPASSQFGGDGNPFRIDYDDGLLNRHGTWTFEIGSVPGPWIFQFKVP